VINQPRLSEFDTGEQRNGRPQNGIPAASNSVMAAARFLLAALWAVAASCHFTVSYPATIAPLDEKTEGNGPCGGADVNSRANVVEWPVAGAPVGFMSTHPSAKYHIMAALSNDTKAWKMLIPGLEQGGKVGFACLTAVPGIAAWVGQPAVVQIHQLSTDGSLFQVWSLPRGPRSRADGASSAWPSSSPTALRRHCPRTTAPARTRPGCP